MYIRRTQTRRTDDGQRYFTYRLVRSERIADKVRQITLLNLGRHFEIEQQHWVSLCARIEELVHGQTTLLPVACPAEVEVEAQRVTAQLLTRQSETATARADTASVNDIQLLDVDSLQLIRPRSVGVEQLGLWAMEQVGFESLLERLGIITPMRAAIVGSIIGRMAAPASERATHTWLRQRSGLGELLAVDYESMDLNRLYRASDQLIKHQSSIEQTVFKRINDLFGYTTTVTLYDLTNTYFEGGLKTNPKAQRGHSKEKRSDCPLLTLGLVLDGSGFVRRSRVFAGNVSEGQTLAEMLLGLGAPATALVVMDRGMASEANLSWLKDNGYRYLVVSRARRRAFDPDLAIVIETAGKQKIHLQRDLSSDGSEVRLYCYSEARAEKERAMEKLFAERFEAGLQKLAEGLSRPRSHKNISKLWVRIGRLKEKSWGTAQHFQIEIVADATKPDQAQAIVWQRQPIDGTRLTHPGVYCLRSNETGWDSERLWRTYIMLTDLEAVFRSLKSELGLRPVYHHKQARCDGHLLITVLAYQFVQIIRQQLKLHGIEDSWKTLRQSMAGQCRITASFRRPDGKALHVRKATRAEPQQRLVYTALDINPAPGGITKTVI